MNIRRKLYLSQRSFNSVFHVTITILSDSIEFEVLNERKVTINSYFTLIPIITQDTFNDYVFVINSETRIFCIKFLGFKIKKCPYILIIVKYLFSLKYIISIIRDRVKIFWIFFKFCPAPWFILQGLTNRLQKKFFEIRSGSFKFSIPKKIVHI